MILTFERKILLQIVAAVESGTGHKVPYTGEGCSRPLGITPGLLLVGDEGVYLLGNNESGPDEPFLIAYANEANTKRMGFHEYRSVKKASFGGDDGVMFLELETVKSTMLTKAIPYIDLTPESYGLGSVDSLDELFEEPVEETVPVIAIAEIEELVEADGEDPDDEDADNEDPLFSWRHYRSYAQVSFDFAIKEMQVDPDDYDYSSYCLEVGIFMNPQSLWAKIELNDYGELGLEQIDFSQALYKDRALCDIAVSEMFDWHDEVEQNLSERSYQITCEFNPARLPDNLDREGFKKVFKEALAEISPKSTLSFKSGEYYRFHDHGHNDDAYLQFLVYKWLMDNRPLLEPQRWLTINSAGANNCFPLMISHYYGWPDCEVNGLI
jgi:hypothetical protein